MSDKKITRRDFLKMAGAGAAVTAVLTGCGPAARYVRRRPYVEMPEYALPGESVYFATACRECPAGCGLVVRTVEGRAIKVEGNAEHPVNAGRTCSRGQAAVQGVYDPDRFRGPVQQSERGSGDYQPVDWDTAVQVVAKALQEDPRGIAFYLGLAPDHLYDLVREITQALGAPAPVRYGALALFEARRTLQQAAERVLGVAGVPSFDIANADVVVSFGANFMETWLSPVAYSRAYGHFRRGRVLVRGYLIQVEPRMSMTAANADRWLPAKPGTEALVALALGRLVAERRGEEPPKAFAGVDPVQVAARAGVRLHDLEGVADRLAQAQRPLVIPGGLVAGQSNGVEAVAAILALNLYLGAVDREGGVYLTPSVVAEKATDGVSSFDEVADLVRRMKQGQVKVLFVHGANPAFELPAALGFAEALAQVPLVISFASFPDETAQLADYVFPDHTALESWGYQRVVTAADRPVLSASQPVVVPLYDTKATADVLLAAVKQVGGALAEKVAYRDEVDFIKRKVLALMGQGGAYDAADPNTFWALFLQHGGWWPAEAQPQTPQASKALLNRALEVPEAQTVGEGEFALVVYPSPVLGDGAGANRPWLQETPDPMTTVMWNAWVEINPETARELGVRNHDVVRLISDYGEVEAVVYVYPGVRPDVVAVPFGQGHTALGRYAEGRGFNPASLLPLQVNEAGDLAFAGVRVRVEKTGRRRPLAHKEHLVGVYGDGAE